MRPGNARQLNTVDRPGTSLPARPAARWIQWIRRRNRADSSRSQEQPTACRVHRRGRTPPRTDPPVSARTTGRAISGNTAGQTRRPTPRGGLPREGRGGRVGVSRRCGSSHTSPRTVRGRRAPHATRTSPGRGEPQSAQAATCSSRRSPDPPLLRKKKRTSKQQLPADTVTGVAMIQRGRAA